MNLDDFFVARLAGELSDEQIAAVVAEHPEAAAFLDRLDAQRAALASEAVWAEPPIGLEDLIVAAVADDDRSEVVVPVSVDGGAPVDHSSPSADQSETSPSTHPPRSGRSGRRRGVRRRLVWSCASAASVAALMALVFVLGADQGNPPEVRVELAGTEHAPSARATAALHDTERGLRIELDLDGLVPAAVDHHYHGWLLVVEQPVSIGSFRSGEQGGAIVLWAAADIDDVSALMITLEPDEGPGSGTSPNVLHGEIYKD